ncbi:MAG: hypothetical protein HZB26_18315 [Candidatus Hydrogenedentes bacterium]|nr:hypothetical protein [Candidatus Hydrogenedentota bacterium]
MGTAQDIAKLCESWWETLADSTKAEQHRYAERFLTLLGWNNPPPIDRRPPGTLSYILRGGSQSAAVAHFLMPGSLESPRALVERGLDYCEVTRALVDATHGLNASYAFITDLHRSYLYDVRTDELLLHADTPAQFNQEFGGALSRSDVEHGSLEEVRRQPRSYLARQLREWCQRWCETLSGEPHVPEELAHQAIDRLLVLRYLFDHDILKRPGWRLQQRYSDLLALAFGPSPQGCGQQLVALFHDIWLDLKTELFAAAPALDAVLEQDVIAAPLLREFSLLSRCKFTIATILESFNYGEAAEKARVRMIPEENADRNAYLGMQTVATVDSVHIEVDISDEGYRAILQWFDKLAALYDRLDTDFSHSAQPRTQEHDELDLFAWSELNAARPHALGDRLHHAIEHGLTVYYTTPRQKRTARLMLYLHVISRYEQSKQRFVRFPSIEGTLKPRPRMLEADRKRIFQPYVQDEWEVI